MDVYRYEYEKDGLGRLLCFGFRPSFSNGEMEKYTTTVEKVCNDVNYNGHFGDEEYVYSTRKERDDAWDEMKDDWEEEA